MLGTIVTILTILLILVCLLMSLLILMQRPKQEGLGAAFGGSLTDKAFGAGTTDVLQKATVFLGVSFFVLSLSIATLMAWEQNADRDTGTEALKEQADAAEEETDDADTNTAPPAEDNPSVNISDPAAPNAEVEINPAPDNGTTPPVEITPPPGPGSEGTAPEEDDAAAQTAPESEEDDAAGTPEPEGDGAEESPDSN